MAARIRKKQVINELKLQQWIDTRKNVLFVGRHGVGKCLGKGTKVLMFDGSAQNVEDIQSGELLMGPDSKPRKVLSTCKGREVMYEVSPTKGDKYTVNSSHILSLKICSEMFGFNKNEIINMNVVNFMNKTTKFKSRALGWRTPINFVSQAVPFDPYLLGVWLGDETSTKLEITTVDPEIEEYLYSCAAVLGLRISRIDENGKTPRFNFSTGKKSGQKRSGRNILRNMFNELNLFNNKHVPDIFKINDRNTRLKVLAGLIDTDGSISNNCYDIITKFPVLADDILFLARSVGLAAYKKNCKKSCIYKGEKFTGHYFRIIISGNIASIPVRISHKKAKERRQIKDVLKTHLEVKKLGIDDYYGFVIDGDHLFVLGDFTVTHNTSIVKQAFETAGLRYKMYSCATLDPWVDFIGVPEKNMDADTGKIYLDLIRPKEWEDDTIEAIFLDEFNRSHKKIRNACMELIQFKSINGRVFPNLKIVWAAINPEDEEGTYDVERLDPAQEDRFHLQIWVPYEPSKEWFAKKYGDDIATQAITWWNSQTIDNKNNVSPRRLEYALDHFADYGDLWDVLPHESGIEHLKQMLGQTPILKEWRTILSSKDSKKAEKFLSDEDNYSQMEKSLLEKKKQWEFALPCLSDEKLTSILCSQEMILNYCISTLMAKSEKVYRVMEDIVKANIDIPVATRIKREMDKLNIPTLAKNIKNNKININKADSFSNAKESHSLEKALKITKVAPMEVTYNRLAAYKSIRNTMPKNLSPELALETLNTLEVIMSRTQFKIATDKFTDFMGIVNKCFEVLHTSAKIPNIVDSKWAFLIKYVSTKDNFYFDVKRAS